MSHQVSVMSKILSEPLIPYQNILEPIRTYQNLSEPIMLTITVHSRILKLHVTKIIQQNLSKHVLDVSEEFFSPIDTFGSFWETSNWV